MERAAETIEIWIEIMNKEKKGIWLNSFIMQ